MGNNHQQFLKTSGVSSEKTNVVNCDDTYDTLCVVDNCVNDENSWIMDTSASQHTTPNRGLRVMSHLVAMCLWVITICAM
jgi:hypothetical protein